MPKGGARARSGPAPSATSLRQNSEEWIKLPASGREAPAPAWPLSEPTGREIELWSREWRRPQAILWEAHGQEIEVALYVRRLAEAETPESPATIGVLVHRMQEALGITQSGLARHHWTIDGAAPVSDAAPASPARRRPSSRSRLKVVQPVVEE